MTELEEGDKIQNLETSEKLEIGKELTLKGAKKMLEQDEYIKDHGTETEELGKKPDKGSQSQQKTGSSDGEYTAKVKPGGLPEGEHKGTIINMEKREVDVGKEDPATYIDMIIDVPDEEGRGKVGYNFYITHNSELGKLLKRFGCNLDVGQEIDIGELLLETPVKFYVQENEDGYSEIKKDTVKPMEGS